MREIGTMWQIGVLTGKLCTFLVKNRSFSAFWHYKNKERLSKGLDVKWHIPSTCLDASRMWFTTGIYSINRASAWLWLKTQETPQNRQNVHRFQVRTPICHIVPVSRAYPPPKFSNFAAETLPAPRRPPSLKPPPLGIFQLKSPPSQRLGLPPSPPPGRKK